MHNYRGSLTFENFTSMNFSMTSGSRASQAAYDVNTDPEVLDATFGEYKKDIELMIRSCFNMNHVSPPEIGSDMYVPGAHDDTTVCIMVELCTFDNAELTTKALSLLLRNMSQRYALSENLKDAQLLVYPSAAKVFGECSFVVKRFSALQKFIAANDAEAFQEVSGLLKRLTKYMTESVDNPKDIVLKNQNIILNLGVDKPVRSLLGVLA
jgi:hypothetical protein